MQKEERALRQMKAVLQRFRGRLDEALEPVGLTTAQLQVLHQISLAAAEGRRVSSAGVARLCGVTPQTIQTLLVRSETAGWVRRSADPENERLVLWSVTASGRRVQKQAEAAFAVVLDRAWKGVPATGMRELLRVAARVLENLEG